MKPTYLWWSVVILVALIPILFWMGAWILGFNSLEDAGLSAAATFAYFVFISSSDNIACFSRDEPPLKEEIIPYVLFILASFLIWLFLFFIAVYQNKNENNPFFIYTYILVIGGLILAYFILKTNFNFFIEDVNKRLERKMNKAQAGQMAKLDVRGGDDIDVQ